tara:strand:+ start:234 stop:500 length:267 start_codon:yes stop_codon:yes gene_type:complete
MNINIKDLKKKIIYRATYRGTKEMDTLLSSFTKKYINKINDKELICLSNLLDHDDETLFRYNQGKKVFDKIEINTITELFKNFDYKRD